MLSFKDARAIVAAHEAASWDFAEGTYYVAPDGYASATHYLVISGTRESLVDNDPSRSLAGGDVPLVDRRTGELSYVPSLILETERAAEFAAKVSDPD